MGEEKITVAWDEIQKHDRPAKSFPAGFPPSELSNPARPKRRGLLIVVCILVGPLILGGAGAGAWFWFIENPTGRSSIERVLREDAALHAEISREVGVLDVVWDQSEATGRYVSGLRKIDLQGCPPEFQDAFRNHIQAWAAYERTARSYGGFSGFIKGFLTGGLAVIGAASEADAAQREIASTWDEVLRIAGKYHATIPE